MANMLDYLLWRGDLLLCSVPFNDIDALVMARLSYMPLDGVVPADFDAPVPLPLAAREVLAGAGQGASQPLEKEDARLLELLAESRRFADIGLCGFVNVFDFARQEQFAALTARTAAGAVIAFRGTDGTLVGWKEDFNMAFAPFVPAQEDAVRYVTEAAAHTDGALVLCGHSKGGNLAVYAGAFCPVIAQERIIAVRNFDGPGFDEAAIARDGFQRILQRTRTYLPESSIVGMLLEHEEDFTIVNSRSVSIWQHNTYLWEVLRDGFIRADARTNSSQFIDRTLKEWVKAMPAADREKLINAIYDAMRAREGATVHDVINGKRLLAVLRAMNDMDADTRRLMTTALRLLGASLKSSLPVFLEGLRLPDAVERWPDVFTERLPDAFERIPGALEKLFHRNVPGDE